MSQSPHVPCLALRPVIFSGMDASDGAKLLKLKPAIPHDWPAIHNHGGGLVPGAVSDENILALWKDDDRYLAAAQFFRYGQQAATAWAATASRWAGLARAAGPKTALTALMPADALTEDHYRQSSRKLTEKELADLLWAPKNSRSAKVVVGLGERVEKNSLNVQWATESVSLYALARRIFETAERKALMAAFAAGALDVAAAMASDLLAAEHAAKVPDEEQEAFFAMPLAERAQRWMKAELAMEARRRGTAHTQTVWTVAMARAWVEQEPEAAKEHIGKAIAEASELWRWADAPKKSAPGELTADERRFAGLVNRAVDIAEISGAQLPEKVILAQDAIAARQAQSKAGAGKTKKSGIKAGGAKNAGQASAPVSMGVAGGGSEAGGGKDRAADGAAEAPWSAEKLKNRQNVLLTALDGLDTEAIEWCLKDGGLTGEKLIFARGSARGGPLDSLCGLENWRNNQKVATHLLKLLEGAGLNFALECKAPGGRQIGNPFIRGAQLTERHGPENGQGLMIALALAQVRSCVALKMDMGDIEAWVKEALNSSQIERIRKYGSGGQNCDAYFQAVKAAIEQVQIGAAAREAASFGKPSDSAGVEGAANTPSAKRRVGRL